MAMYDWNGNGKKDMADDFIEYNIYKECTGKHEDTGYYRSSHKGGISTFGAILATILGLVVQAVIYYIFGVNVEDVPVVLIVILWIGFSAVIGNIFDNHGI